jgi:4-amino-4-deoxy-L-arabinose transferase-like glycosyltransferase
MIREDRLALASLGAGSIAINLGLLAILGVQRGADTVRYLASAADLLAGRFRGQNGLLYIGYNGLLAVSEAAGGGELGVIVVQFLAAACATLALYDLGRQLAGRLAGALAAAFFVIDYDIARWHLYLLTDSLYISLVPIATWAVHRAAERGGQGIGTAAVVASRG